jgi:hypothetical protein
MAEWLEHGGRQFQVMAYHDAVQDEAWAIELAELADQELGPSLVTVLFPDDSEPQVLLYDGKVPLAILTAFMAAVARDPGPP